MLPDPVRDVWLMFQREHNCSVDRMLCSPSLRNEFLSAAQCVASNQNEEQILLALVRLRKKKMLPRTER